MNTGVIGVDRACDEQREGWAASGIEIHAAAPLTHPEGQVWLRLWARTLVLAFLVARPLPRVPAAAGEGWLALSPRGRECLLTAMIGGAVTPRAPALRASYDPGRLASVITAVAGRMLDLAAAENGGPGPGVPPVSASRGLAPDGGNGPVPFRAGHVWVIPQLRWLHEVERAHPLGQERIRLEDFAPPLEFGLAGLPDWPGIKIRDRLGGLRRHPLSMTTEHNRQSATIALLGGEPGAGLDADLAMAGTELGPRQRLRHAARMMRIGGRGSDPGWLEVVLSWPHRIIGSAAE
ncbi:MAG: hypothetical protein ACRDPY_07405 [Streptosporangiaceae bacterium]